MLKIQKREQKGFFRDRDRISKSSGQAHISLRLAFLTRMGKTARTQPYHKNQGSKSVTIKLLQLKDFFKNVKKERLRQCL